MPWKPVIASLDIFLLIRAILLKLDPIITILQLPVILAILLCVSSSLWSPEESPACLHKLSILAETASTLLSAISSLFSFALTSCIAGCTSCQTLNKIPMIEQIRVSHSIRVTVDRKYLFPVQRF